MTKIERKTRETDIQVEITTGTGTASIDTGVPFLDHMMTTFARFSGLDVTVAARGDLRHHVIEDVAIATGTALASVIPETCSRYGDRTIAMDDALVQVVLDAGGRPFYEGPLPSGLYDHWMRCVADNAKITIHIQVVRGKDRHHIVESAFKALGLALRDALIPSDDVFSTKGRVTVKSGSC